MAGEHLFTATVELVSKRGYRDTSVDHIVKAAGVGRVAFYELYEDKEDCFLAAFDRIVEEGTEAVAAAVAGAEGWPEEMVAALDCLLELAAADPQRARIALVEVQAAGPRAYDHYKEVVDRAAPKLRQGREFSQEAAMLSDALEEAILGGITWIVHQRLAKGELGDPDALVAETIQIALSPYLGDEEAKRLAAATLQDRALRN
ncbi:MAG TPA: TetR/AcrR family transcriptional regulator [Solirubrobacterales bacterium]